MVRAALLSTIIVASSACQTTDVKIVDLVQREGDDKGTCGKGKLPYVWPDRKVGVCWPENVVAYVVCVEHLSVASTREEETRKAAIEAAVKVLDKVEAGPKLSAEEAKVFATTMVNEGDIARARAESIKTCSQLLDPAKRAEVKALLAS